MSNLVRSTSVRTYQRGITSDDRLRSLAPFLATVETIHTDRMTCDLVALNGMPLHNIPVLSRVGLQDEEIYGELDMPAVGDVVVVIFAGSSGEEQVIVGSIAPFLFSKYAGEQTAANSGSKVYTKKLLEKDLGKGYRRIFKSGTTVEVEDDGTLTIETPSGTFIRIEEGVGLTINDENGNTFVMGSADVTITGNGNTFVMDSTKVTINGNLEVLQ